MTRILVLPLLWQLLFAHVVFLVTAKGESGLPRKSGRSSDFNSRWLFSHGDTLDACKPDFDESGWRKLDLPHDFSSEADFSPTNASATGYLPGGVGWYRKHFVLPRDAAGKRVLIEFDGVQRNSDVWINGVHLGHRPYGYISFRYDLTPHLRPGGQSNLIVVRTERQNVADSRWYPGTGIYRNVKLTIVNPLHIIPHGVFVTTPTMNDEQADIVAQVEVFNSSASSQNARVNTQVLDPDGHVVAEAKGSATLPPNASATVSLWQRATNPQPWSVDIPRLYTLRTRVEDAQGATDEVLTQFGIRQVRFDANEGFFLNGKSLKVKGVCVHHDGGAVGAAVPPEVWLRRLRILKEIGVNAIRCSHNPMAAEFYDLCDQLGLLVMDEAFDEWEIGKRKWVEGRNVGKAARFGYSQDFAEWAEADCTEMVRRSRNHPSIVLWSIGNEIDYPTDPYVLEVTRSVEGFRRDANAPQMTRLAAVAPKLIAAIKRQDPTRPITMALANQPSSDAIGLASMLDVVGYNYQEHLYEQVRRDFPGRVFLGSENGKRLDAWQIVETNDWMSAQFLWTGIDFLGEAGRWPVHGSSAGLFDTRCLPKPEAWHREALWSTNRVVRLAAAPGAEQSEGRGMRGLRAHWNWPNPEANIQVVAFSNCEEVELSLNGVSIGRKSVGLERYATFSVAFAPGRLEATGFLNGKPVTRSALQTAGAPAAVRIEVEREEIPAKNGGVTHAIISVVDANNVILPDFSDVITISVSGSGRLLAVDNGDLQDSTALRSPAKRPRNGRLLAIVEAAPGEQPLRIQATCKGLKSAEAKL